MLKNTIAMCTVCVYEPTHTHTYTLTCANTHATRQPCSCQFGCHNCMRDTRALACVYHARTCCPNCFRFCSPDVSARKAHIHTHTHTAATTYTYSHTGTHTHSLVWTCSAVYSLPLASDNSPFVTQTLTYGVCACVSVRV